MLKYFIGSVFIVCSLVSKCQDTCKISLGKFSIKSKYISVKISGIADARADKNTIGIIQVGSQNQKDSASFYLPGVQEVEELLTRSDLMSHETGFLMRIRKLGISEITKAEKKTIKAELSVDFLLQEANYYYPVETMYLTSEYNGQSSHAENIVGLIKDSLFSLSVMERHVRYEQPFTKEDLLDPDLNLR